MTVVVRAALVAAVLALGSVAHADAPSPGGGTSPKRALPDYDGVPGRGTTALEGVAWVPRIVLFPVYLVSEYVIRRPLGWLVVTAERGNWPSEIISFFTFGGQQHIGIVPTTYVDLGFHPTVGFYFFWDEFLHPRHGIRLRVSVWDDGYTFSLANRIRVGSDSRLQLRTEAVRRPDQAFYGIGPRSLDDDLSRYGMDRLTAELSLTGRLGFGEAIRGAFTVRDQTFRNSTCCSGAPIDDAIAMGLYPAPAGYPDGYTAFVGHLDASADSREPWPGLQNGFRIAASVDVGTATEGLGSWIRTGGTLGAFWDVGGTGRVLGLTASAAFVEPLGDSDLIPFLELVHYGGNGTAMPGFRPDRLVGLSGASASLRYEWPVWAMLAGSLQFEIGNVFGAHFEDFDTDLLRLSAAIGLRSMGANDHELQFLLGVGTETFADGTELTSIRLAIGGTYGF